MSRNRPLVRRDSQAIPLASLRAQELARLRHALERLHSPRLQMSVIVALTGAVGFLSSVTLLHFRVHQLWLRYPLAVAIAYAGFLLFLWCWLRLKRSDVLDGIDVPWDGSSPGAGHCSSTHSPGGGGHGEIMDATPDIDFGEAAAALLCIAALACAVWMAYWTVLSAPALFAKAHLRFRLSRWPISPPAPNSRPRLGAHRASQNRVAIRTRGNRIRPCGHRHAYLRT